MERAEISKFISEKFVKIRRAHNITARKLSRELGQSSQYINQIESGNKLPSLEGLFSFCEYFNMPLSVFFDEKQTYPVQYERLNKYLNKLSEDDIKAITYIARGMAENKK